MEEPERAAAAVNLASLPSDGCVAVRLTPCGAPAGRALRDGRLRGRALRDGRCGDGRCGDGRCGESLVARDVEGGLRPVGRLLRSGSVDGVNRGVAPRA